MVLPCIGHPFAFWCSPQHLPYGFAMPLPPSLILAVSPVSLSWVCHALVTLPHSSGLSKFYHGFVTPWSPFLVLVLSLASTSWFCHDLVTLPHSGGLIDISLIIFPCRGHLFSL